VHPFQLSVLAMFQETKQSPPDDHHFTMPSSSFSTQHPFFRDLSDLPRSVGPDFVASSSTLTASPDVYRSIEQPSGGVFTSDSNWTSTSYMPSHFGRKELDVPTQSFSQFGYNDHFSSASHYDKSKSMEDLHSPRIQTFPSSASVNTVPPPLPEYIEPSYNFASKTQATELYQSVLSHMKRNAVDVDCKPEKFRIKCKSYASCSLLYFVVRIYRGVKKGESVVECQRRTGDVLRFADLYRTLKKQVDLNSIGETPAAASSQLEIISEHAQETVQCLLLMASSHFVDVKSKAVEALANLSSQDRNVQDILIKSGSINLLLDGCAKFDKVEDVHRPSLTALANLSDGRADVCRTIAEKRLRCLSTYTSKENPQVVRECARVLSNIGHNMKDAMRGSDCVSGAVKNLSRSTDTLTLQCVRKLEDCIGL